MLEQFICTILVISFICFILASLFMNAYFSPCSDNKCVVLKVLPCVLGYIFNACILYKFLNSYEITFIPVIQWLTGKNLVVQYLTKTISIRFRGDLNDMYPVQS